MVKITINFNDKLFIEQLTSLDSDYESKNLRRSDVQTSVIILLLCRLRDHSIRSTSNSRKNCRGFSLEMTLLRTVVISPSR